MSDAAPARPSFILHILLAGASLLARVIMSTNPAISGGISYDVLVRTMQQGGDMGKTKKSKDKDQEIKQHSEKGGGQSAKMAKISGFDGIDEIKKGKISRWC